MEAIERYTVSQDWITLLILFVLVLLVGIKYTFPQRFNHFILLFATDKYLLLKGKNPSLFHPFNLLFFTINVLIVSMFAFVFFEQVAGEPPERPKVLYLRIATAYTAFILLKFAFEKILANIVALDKKLDFYLFYKLSYRNFMALALLPVCILFIYIWEPSLTVLYVCIGLLIVLNIVTLISFYKKNHQYLMGRWFYFILYLCALEIGPYFILYKLITKL